MEVNLNAMVTRPPDNCKLAILCGPPHCIVYIPGVHVSISRKQRMETIFAVFSSVVCSPQPRQCLRLALLAAAVNESGDYCVWGTSSINVTELTESGHFLSDI